MKLEKLLSRYEDLKKMLNGLGIVCQGSIMKRMIKGNGREFGPYYQWTRKIKGKTVNVNLRENEVKEYEKAIKNERKLEKILSEMRKISLEILQIKTKSED